MRYKVCIVGINIGTLFIISQFSKILNNMLIITSLNLEEYLKFNTLIDSIPHTYLKYGNSDRCVIYSGDYLKILESFDIINIDNLQDVEVCGKYVKVRGLEYTCENVICGDEIVKLPDYTNFEYLDKIRENSVDVILYGSDIFKIYELYNVFRQYNDGVYVDYSLKNYIDDIFMHRDVAFSSDNSFLKINVDLETVKPRVLDHNFVIYKVASYGIVRDFELLLKSMSYILNSKIPDFKINMSICFDHAIIHVGDLPSSIRSMFSEVSTCRSCVDYDVGRVCCRFIHFSDILLSFDVYCSDITLLPICESYLYSSLYSMYNISIPHIFSIRGMYFGDFIYTPMYSPILNIALSRFKKEFK